MGALFFVVYFRRGTLPQKRVREGTTGGPSGGFEPGGLVVVGRIFCLPSTILLANRGANMRKPNDQT